MKKIKKCLATILAVIMLFSIVPLGAITVKADSSVTLESLQKKYPHGKYWNGGNANSYTSTPCTHHGSCSYSGACGCNTFKGHAIQCMGFAYQLAYLIYGGDPYADWTVNRNVSALNSLKAGDVVRYKNDGHSIFITAVNGDTVTYADCNSDGHCKIRWGQTLSKSTLKATFTYVDSAPYAWSGNGNTLSIKYDANGGIIAGSDVTYQKYSVATSAGVNMRSGAGIGYDTVFTIPTGKTFVVTSTKIANGYTWGQTTYNDKTGWCVISEDWTTKAGTQPATKYYLNSSGVVYTSSTGAVKVQEMVDGETYDSGLYNYTTFGISRTGYTFAGWGTSSSGGTVYSQSESMTAKKLYSSISSGSKTITLYAIWEPNILSVYFNANGASLDSDTYKLSNNLVYYKSDNSRHVQKWTYNNKKTDGLVNAATLGLYKTGYTFAGWGTQASGGTIYSQSDTDLLPLTINSNLKNGNCSTTLYAIWKANEYTIKYDANGGTGAPANQIKTHDKVLTLSSVTPRRDGYTFLGWGSSKDSTSIVNYPGGTYGSNQNYTYYAIWEANEYTIKYDANGGTGVPQTQTKTYGKTLTISNTVPTRNGYTFKGWATTSTATVATYLPGGSYTSNSAVTLYAVWEKVTLTKIETNAPSKTVYYTGDSLDTSGLIVRATYSDGTSSTVYSGFTTSGFDSTSTGVKTVVVSYGGKTTTFNVEVIAASVSLSKESIALDVGDTYDLIATTSPIGGSVKWSVCDSDIITASNGKITAKSAGTTTVEVTFEHNGYYSFATCDITVNAPAVDANAPRVVVEHINAKVGEKVLVTINLENNPGIWGMDLKVDYDETQLKLTGVTNGTIFNTSEWTQGNLSGEQYILSYEASGLNNIITNGVLTTLEFTVSKNATVDSFSSISLSYNAGDIINVNFDDINIAIISGGINITDCVYGDLNGDGLINKKDSLLMKMYLADNSTSIDMQAADVYVDGSINKKDSLYLKQYLAGLDVELGS